MRLTGRSLMLIAPFLTHADALDMITGLTSWVRFPLIAVQKHLKALPKTETLPNKYMFQLHQSRRRQQLLLKLINQKHNTWPHNWNHLSWDHRTAYSVCVVHCTLCTMALTVKVYLILIRSLRERFIPSHSPRAQTVEVAVCQAFDWVICFLTLHMHLGQLLDLLRGISHSGLCYENTIVCMHAHTHPYTKVNNA